MSTRPRLLIVAATRSDILHITPLMRAFTNCDRYALPFDIRFLVTRQEDTELDQALTAMVLRPDDDLGVKTPRLADAALAAKLLELMEQSLRKHAPSAVLAVGYTASSWATGVASYFKGIPLIHLGAGEVAPTFETVPRPFPEWQHARVLAGRVALHLALDEAGEKNLENAILPESTVKVVGHGTDALLKENLNLKADPDPALQDIAPEGERILIFLRRREHHANAARPMCMALNHLARHHSKTFFVCPFSLQAHICDALDSLLEPCENLRVCAPLPYGAFVREMARSRLIITDSSGVAREGLLLGRPVLALDSQVISAGLTSLAANTEGHIEVVEMQEQTICEAVNRHLANDPPESNGPVIELDAESGSKTSEAIIQWWEAAFNNQA